MSTPVKSPIAKSKQATSLLELSADAVIKQSIEQGKSNDIIRMLKAHPKGSRALKALHPPLEEVICVNMASSDGVTEGVAGFIPVKKARWFMELFEEYESRNQANKKDDPAWRSALGGVALKWQELTEASEWATETLTHLDNDTIREIVEDTLGLTIEDDEDEEMDEEDRDDGVDVDAWVGNHSDDIDTAFQEQLGQLFDETNLLKSDNSALLTPAQVDALMARGQLKTRVTVTIDLDSWA
jgi:hypothetical protein